MEASRLCSVHCVALSLTILGFSRTFRNAFAQTPYTNFIQRKSSANTVIFLAYNKLRSRAFAPVEVTLVKYREIYETLDTK